MKGKKLTAVVLTGAMAAVMMAGCGSSSSTGSSSAGSTAAKSTSAASSSAASTASESAGESAASSAASSSSVVLPTTNTSGKDYTIKVDLKTMSSEYWQYVQAGCEQAGKDLGVTVDVLGATSETAYDEQQSALETILNSNQADALVVSPLQSDNVATLIANTEIPVIAIDTKIDSDKVVSFVGFDNEDIGEMAGKAGVEAAKKAGWDEITAVGIVGVQGDETSENRLSGFQKGVSEAGGTYLEGETQYADAVADKAVNCMEGIVQSHPEGVAVIWCNNDDMAIAAARACRDVEAYKNTIFVGCGGQGAGLDSILEGKYENMTAAVDGYDVGYKGVQAAVAALNGDKLPEFIPSKGQVVDSSNAQEVKDMISERLGK